MHLWTSKKALFGPGGGMGSSPRKPVSLAVGVIFLALGLIPLLNTFGVISFTIPVEPVGMILWVLAVIGGILLLWDVIGERLGGMVNSLEGKMRMVSGILALILLAIGIIPILNSLQVFDFSLPPLVGTVKDVLFTLVGIVLLYGGTKSM